MFKAHHTSKNKEKETIFSLGLLYALLSKRPDLTLGSWSFPLTPHPILQQLARVMITYKFSLIKSKQQFLSCTSQMSTA